MIIFNNNDNTNNSTTNNINSIANTKSNDLAFCGCSADCCGMCDDYGCTYNTAM